MKMKNGITLWRGFGKPIYHLVFDPLLGLYSKNILSKVYHHQQKKYVKLSITALFEIAKY